MQPPHPKSSAMDCKSPFKLHSQNDKTPGTENKLTVAMSGVGDKKDNF
jgi:hypothetical protein